MKENNINTDVKYLKFAPDVFKDWTFSWCKSLTSIVFSFFKCHHVSVLSLKKCNTNILISSIKGNKRHLYWKHRTLLYSNSRWLMEERCIDNVYSRKMKMVSDWNIVTFISQGVILWLVQVTGSKLIYCINLRYLSDVLFTSVLTLTYISDQPLIVIETAELLLTSRTFYRKSAALFTLGSIWWCLRDSPNPLRVGWRALSLPWRDEAT